MLGGGAFFPDRLQQTFPPRALLTYLSCHDQYEAYITVNNADTYRKMNDDGLHFCLLQARLSQDCFDDHNSQHECLFFCACLQTEREIEEPEQLKRKTFLCLEVGGVGVGRLVGQSAPKFTSKTPVLYKLLSKASLK